MEKLANIGMYEHYISAISGNLMACMVMLFVAAVVIRFIINRSYGVNWYYVNQFGKLVRDYAEKGETSWKETDDFKEAVDEISSATFDHEVTNRIKYHRRKGDRTKTIINRLFQFDSALAELTDTIRKKPFYHEQDNSPNFQEYTRRVFHNTKTWNRIMGFIPINGAKNFTNVLPGLLIVFGVLGTFAGIVMALPLIQGLDFSDFEKANTVMGAFISRVKFAMNTSVLGISLSIVLTLYNSFVSTDEIKDETLDQFEESIKVLWDTMEREKQENVTDTEHERWRSLSEMVGALKEISNALAGDSVHQSDTKAA